MSKFKRTGKKLVHKETGAEIEIFIYNNEEGVKTVEFFGGVTSGYPLVSLKQIVLENFDVKEVN